MKVLLILTVLFFACFSSAAKFDEQTRTRLIEKFSRVYDQLADEEPAKINVTLRLADLLSEQGRFLANKELGEGCNVCNAGVEERQKALDFYGEAAGQLQNDKRASVLIQMGHLQELLGKENLAIDSYTNATKVSINPSYLNEAQFSLAEIYFKQRRFDQAVKYYSLVVAHPDKKGQKRFCCLQKSLELIQFR